MRRFRFNTKSPDRDAYETFIANLRDAVASGIEVDGFIVLRDPRRVTNLEERFILVELTNSVGNSITVAIDVTNLYVVGYRTEDVSFFFEENDFTRPPYNRLFNNTQRHSLGFGGRYVGSRQLEATAAATREDYDDHGNRVTVNGRRAIELGIEALDDAIQSLSFVTPHLQRSFRARNLLVVIQMVSEAVRFRYIEQEVLNTITSFRNRRTSYTNMYPNTHMLSLENQWDSLSDQILQASGGTFPRGVQLDPCTGFSQDAYEVNEITWSLYADVAVIKYAEFENQVSTSRRNRGHHNDQNETYDYDPNRPSTSRRSQGRQNQNRPSTSRRNQNRHEL